MARIWRGIVLTLASLGCLGSLGCQARTDRELYVEGDSGEVEFENSSGETAYLGGCTHFEQQELVDGAWVSRGGEFVCFWEGFADPVEPGAVAVDAFTARTPGSWRLRYAVGTGCAAGEPLAADRCESLGQVVSNRFEVVRAPVTTPPCIRTGCSGQVCAPLPVVTSCEYLPEYACLRQADCVPAGPLGLCAFQDTPASDQCFAELE